MNTFAHHTEHKPLHFQFHILCLNNESLEYKKVNSSIVLTYFSRFSLINKEMQKQVLHPYITMDRRISKGSPVIVGTRTRVLDIAIEYEYLGIAPDKIVDAHPHLTLPQVHDALSFYYEHREELDMEIRERKGRIEGIRKNLAHE
jgi:uncharacterized protein (DUF433 family)